jgi:saccharopine dehydrogenase-like NADP-dependent oxidoreductase
MRVRASGVRNGGPARFNFDFVDRFDAASGLRSMSRSTGFTATAVASLILDGTLKEPGVHAPETLGTLPGVLDRVLAYLQARGVHCEMFAGS